MIKRRNSLLVTASAIAALTLAACGGGAGGGEAEGDMPTLNRGISAKVDTLDPHQSSAQWENIIIGDMIIGLTTHAEDGLPINGMAESWTTSDDGLVWTFTLGDHVWSDGVPVTAYDFEFAFRRIQDPELASQYSSLLYLIKGAKEINLGEAEPETLGVRAIDAKTLEIELVGPAPYLPGLLTHYTTYPVPKHVVEEHGETWIDPDNIVTNGPYKLVYWQPGQPLVSEHNPTGFGADDVCFKRIVYHEIETPSTYEAMLEAGTMDINNAFDLNRRAEIEKRFPGWTKTTPALITTYWSFNQTTEPFDDVRVRKAIAMTIDREFITEKVLPGYVPAYALVPPGMDNYDVPRPKASWADWPMEQRLEEARSLLTEAGYGPDNPLQFDFIYRSTGGNDKPPPVALENWKEIADWVNPTVEKQDTKALYARLRTRDFIMSDAAWAADYDDPQNFLYLLDSATGQQNYGFYNNPEYDRLLAEASKELDLKKRAELLAEAETIMLEEVPVAPMWFQVTQNMVNPEITGYTDNAVDQHRSRFMCKPGLSPVGSSAE